ncbi:benzoate/H(+) symporter BenE family transporter [Archangium minus]|uniref:Benzoate/H(+) symporter BenE family transporter n=1 Tax=Archangium minus TaxID=83450 RepID=A0ABY9WNR2_9BACT|nr:benzoate/H(+) symporter BenE family transporter [Archangium minus]
MEALTTHSSQARALSWSNITAGFVTVLVGFSSTGAIVFQAAAAAGATQEQVSSWMGALGLGMGATCIGLSLRYRVPVITAWSTPGAALLATSLAGVPMAEAIGVFLFSAALVTLCGVTGLFEKALNHISLPLAAAMLAGILARFGIDVFVAMKSQFALVFAMLATYVLGKRLWPRYAVIVVLALGSAVAWALNLMHFDAFQFALATPSFTAPAFSWSTLLGIGVPFFVVTMASQNVPGVAVIRASGYQTPISPLITTTGLTTLLLAPFGCFSLSLAAITAAICMGREAHEDPSKRYVAGIFAGLFYLLAGLFGATIGALFAALPRELVLAVAGMALFATIANSLNTALLSEHHREPAIVTFLVALSGVSLFGIGAAFWALVGGALTSFALNWRREARPPPAGKSP